MPDSPNNLEERTLVFSKKIIHLCREVEITAVTKPMIEQLILAASGIGAEYARAGQAATSEEYVHTLQSARKQAAETKYWLRLLADVHKNKQACKLLWRECHAILTQLQRSMMVADEPVEVSPSPEPDTENAPRRVRII